MDRIIHSGYYEWLLGLIRVERESIRHTPKLSAFCCSAWDKFRGSRQKKDLTTVSWKNNGASCSFREAILLSWTFDHHLSAVGRHARTMDTARTVTHGKVLPYPVYSQEFHIHRPVLIFSNDSLYSIALITRTLICTNDKITFSNTLDVVRANAASRTRVGCRATLYKWAQLIRRKFGSGSSRSQSVIETIAIYNGSATSALLVDATSPSRTMPHSN